MSFCRSLNYTSNTRRLSFSDPDFQYVFLFFFTKIQVTTPMMTAAIMSTPTITSTTIISTRTPTTESTTIISTRTPTTESTTTMTITIKSMF
jgi:hypothetical protein